MFQQLITGGERDTTECIADCARVLTCSHSSKLFSASTSLMPVVRGAMSLGTTSKKRSCDAEGCLRVMVSTGVTKPISKLCTYALAIYRPGVPAECVMGDSFSVGWEPDHCNEPR